MLHVGLCGLAGAGKSTVARLLVSEFGYVRRPFAYPLKAMVAALGVPPSILDGTREDKEVPLPALNGRTARYALQTLGTEWGRNLMGEDFWVKWWAAGAVQVSKSVADDVRFPNEAQAVRDLGGVVIRVDRDGAGSKTGADHASENIDAIPFDYVINNNGTMDDIISQLGSIISRFRIAEHKRLQLETATQPGR